MALQERILSVLGAFNADRPSLSLSEIAEITGLPVSTAHRLVANLVAWGALERDERRRYVIGLRLWEIGVLSPRAYQHRARILPFLEELFVATREHVVLTALHDGEGIMVEQLLGRRGARLAAGLGERLPLHASSPGHVFLAFGPPELWETVEAEPLHAYTSRTITDRDALRVVVREVRRTSIAISEGAIVSNTVSISAPIFAQRGDFYGAVSLVATIGTVDPNALAPSVLRAARLISAALAHAGDETPFRPLRRAEQAAPSRAGSEKRPRHPHA
ncbi:IclR family transcriptional regulator [Pseudolysinimonas sp.]